LNALPDGQRPAIVLLSSAAEPLETQCRQELGITRCLTKPVKRSDLLEAIEYVLGKRPTPQPVPAAGASLVESRAPLRVLLAEDNVVNQKLASKLLERRGHTVTIVANGRLALEALERDCFDLALMDVQMPGLGGLEVVALIREKERRHGGHIPIVALTAHAMTGDRERCLKAGMDAYLSKPIRPPELFEVLDSLTAVEAPRA
jgi:two-component system sensor histidine kinase/response regulator